VLSLIYIKTLPKLIAGRITKEEIVIEKIKLESVFDKLPLGMFILEENGVIIAANKLFCKFLTLKKEEVVGQNLNNIIKEEIELATAYQEHHQNEQNTVTTKTGSSLKIEFQPVQTRDKNKVVYLGIILNQHELNQLESELQKQIDIKDSLRDKLEEENELSEMKSRFLSIASHEFRTPLAGILSSLNLINRYFDADQETWFKFKNKEKVTNHLDKIYESVKNLTTVLQKFLALGNIKKGEIPVKPIPFDLKKAITKQTNQFQAICKPGQKIFFVHKSRKVTVTLDKYLLKNIMNNLISNAIKFSPERTEITVSTEIFTHEIRITVSDSGIGIPHSEQNKIFRRFFRARNALTYEEGTGLGLNIVQKYVELMKGKITFTSEENKGTTFNIIFPKLEK